MNPKKIILICRELDKDGLYRQSDKIFNKFAQNIGSVATPTQDTSALSSAYSQLKTAPSVASKTAQDIFSTLSQIRPEKITQFLTESKKSNDLKSIVDLFVLYCQQWSSQASYAGNKIIASSINSQQKSLYIFPIFNNYFQKYPKLAVVLGYIVLSLLMHPVVIESYRQGLIFTELFGQNMGVMDKPSGQFLNSSNYVVQNTSACLNSMVNELLKNIVESYTEKTITVLFITSEDPDYRALNDISRLFFKSAPYLNLVMDSEDVANIQADDTQANATVENQACANSLQSLGSIDTDIYNMLMQICDVIKNGDPDNYPKFNQDLIDCGYAQGTPTAGIGSQGSMSDICPKALQWLADLYNSVPTGSPEYRKAIYDESAQVSMMGIITSNDLTQFLNTGTNDTSSEDES